MLQLTTIAKTDPAKMAVVVRRMMTMGAFAAFFLFGFSDNLKGPTLPALLTDLDFSYSLGGTILMGSYLGFLVATLLTGPLADISNTTVVLFVALLCLILGISGYSLSSSAMVLMGAMVIFGMGIGALELGANLVIVENHSHNKGRYLNLLAFFHAIGSMAAPLYAGHLLAAAVSWRRIYQSSLILVLALLLYLLVLSYLLAKYPQSRAKQAQGFDLKSVGKSVFTTDMLLAYLVITLYVAAEISVGTWLVEFLQRTKSQSVVMSSRYLALFFAALTAGRLMGSFVVERSGYINTMLMASLAANLCLIIGTFAPPPFAFFLPLTGFFFSIIFPTMTAVVSDRYQENAGTILGLLFACAGVGGMLGPWAVGLASDWSGGIGTGFGLVIGLSGALSGVLWLLYRADRHVPKGA